MIRTFILAVQTAPANNAGMNLWDMVVMGGWLMIVCYHYLHRLRKILAYSQNRANGCPFHGKNTRNLENRKHTCRTRRM